MNTINLTSMTFRFSAFRVWQELISEQGGYEKFTRGYEKFGFQISTEGITYREWAPNAKEAFLFGDFSKSEYFLLLSSILLPLLPPFLTALCLAHLKRPMEQLQSPHDEG